MAEEGGVGVAAALATLVIRRAVCVAGISLIQTCARLALVCLSTSLPLSLLSSTNLPPLSLLHLVSPLCNFPLQLVIASYIAYYPRTKRSFHFQLPSLTPFPPPLATLSLLCRICLKQMMMFSLAVLSVSSCNCITSRSFFAFFAIYSDAYFFRLCPLAPCLPSLSPFALFAAAVLHCLCLLLCALSLAAFSVSISALATFCDCHELLHSTQAAAYSGSSAPP